MNSYFTLMSNEVQKENKMLCFVDLNIAFILWLWFSVESIIYFLLFLCN